MATATPEQSETDFSHRVIEEAAISKVSVSALAYHKAGEPGEAEQYLDYLSDYAASLFNLDEQAARGIAVFNMRTFIHEDKKPLLPDSAVPAIWSDEYTEWYDRRINWARLCGIYFDPDKALS